MELMRKAELFDNLVEWAFEHDKEFIDCFFNASGATDEERKEVDEEANGFPPIAVYAGFEEIGYEEGMTDDEIGQLILDYLSDNYGFCVNDFRNRPMGKGFMVTGIDWDKTE